MVRVRKSLAEDYSVMPVVTGTRGGALHITGSSRSWDRHQSLNSPLPYEVGLSAVSIALPSVRYSAGELVYGDGVSTGFAGSDPNCLFDT